MENWQRWVLYTRKILFGTFWMGRCRGSFGVTLFDANLHYFGPLFLDYWHIWVLYTGHLEEARSLSHFSMQICISWRYFLGTLTEMVPTLRKCTFWYFSPANNFCKQKFPSRRKFCRKKNFNQKKNSVGKKNVIQKNISSEKQCLPKQYIALRHNIQ